jgi:WD40 repeat protein/serine/threonine protein kinase
VEQRGLGGATERHTCAIANIAIARDGNDCGTVRAMRAVDELSGRRLGEFTVRERIGEGGFGGVYRCEQPGLGREAVVKVLHQRLRNNEVVMQRFLREAQLAAKLDHPYAAHVYAFGVEATDGLAWIAMEMVQGTALNRWLLANGPLPLAELVPFFERIAEVVHTAHEAGIVHRDLKPSNIMVIERAGRLLPKLLDFGIAKLVDDAARATEGRTATARVPLKADALEETATFHSRDTAPAAPLAGISGPLTRADSALGSPPYMSPEQWVDAMAVGPRSDLYALGVIAFEALTGHRPFQAATAAELAALHATGEVPALGNGLPDALDAVIRRALSKHPGDRHATALELAAAMRAASGLVPTRVDLPKLAPAIRDLWIAQAPQPLAETIAAVEGARNAHQAREAVRDAVRGLVRYLVALALAARAQVHQGSDDPALTDLLLALRRRDLDDEERVRLLALLVAPFADRAGAHPIPELVGFRAIPASAIVGDSAGSDEHVFAELERAIPELARLLHEAAFVLAYTLVVPRDGLLERWTGLRRARRPVVDGIEASDAPDGRPLIIDARGRPVVRLWPLAQSATPIAGADPEVFLFEGRGRHGARLLAASGFEHHDGAVWEWLGEHVIGELDVDTHAAADDRPPYLGLTTFATGDADRFVGRERETDMFLNRLRNWPLQIVVGASGAGKSSFVHAGVIPALPPRWRAITMRTGSAPLSSLGARLADGGVTTTELRPVLESAPEAAAALIAHAARGDTIVLVVDQLEELFTVCQDARERERFAALLSALAASPDAPTRVVATIRDDFLMHLEGLAPVRALLGPSLFLLGNPSRADLVRTIVEPARRAGFEMSDPELADDMVRAVAERPGALALVSFTAARLWELRDRAFRQLTRKAYDAMGGVGGALGRHAEDTLAMLSSEEQRLARDAFRHLVTSEGTRAIITADELRERLGSPRAGGVIEKLVAARLLSIVEVDAESRIEIVHETLISAWPRLQQWVREDLDGARMREQLRHAARQWHERSRARELLWRGDMLHDLERWRARDGASSELEAAFADASRTEARRARRIRLGAAAVAFAVLLGALVVLLALNREARVERTRAEAATVEAHDQRERAEQVAQTTQRQLAARYVEQGRLSLLDGHAGASLAYLLAAVEQGATIDPPMELLLAEAARQHRSVAVWSDHDLAITSFDVSRDGRFAVSAGDDQTIRFWELASGKVLATAHATAGYVRFSPDARCVVASAFSGATYLVDRTGAVHELTKAPLDGTGYLTYPAFDAEGARVATLRGAATVLELRDVARGASVLSVPTGLRYADRIAFDPKHPRVAVTGGNSIAILDTHSGSRLAMLDGHTAPLLALEFSPDGNSLVSSSYDHTARIWDLVHHTVRVLQAHSDTVDHALFDPGGRWVVTASRDGTSRVWRADTGDLVALLDKQASAITTARYDADGERLVTGAADGTVHVWDVATGIRLASFEGHVGMIVDARFAGAAVISAGADGTIRAWNPDQGIRILRHTTPISDLAASPDGQLAISAAEDGVRVWNLRDGRLVSTLGEGVAQTAVAMAPDGRTVVAASDFGAVTAWFDGREQVTVRPAAAQRALVPTAFGLRGSELVLPGSDATGLEVWSLEARRTVLAIPGEHGVVAGLELGGARDIALTASTGGGVAVWDLERRRLEHRWDASPGLQVMGAFALGDARVVTADENGETILWTRDGSRVKVFPRHAGGIRWIDVSRSGERLAIAGVDGEIEVWDLAQRGVPLLGRMIGHTKAVNVVRFDPSGDFVVSGGADDTVKIWSTVGGRLLASSRSHQVGVLGLRVTDRWIASAGHEGNIVVRARDRDPVDLAELRRRQPCLAVALVDGRIEPRRFQDVLRAFKDGRCR